MKFDVYCDENMPDLFCSSNPKARYMTIGSLWSPTDIRSELKNKIWEIKRKHNAWGEIKWTKVSPSKLEFYNDLIDLFLSYGTDLRFRCIAVDSNAVNMELHNGDAELGFYKFYYQLLHHWVLDFNKYNIYCDIKPNRDLSRLNVLKRCLSSANASSSIECVQFLPSKEVSLIQMCDLLLGAASSRLNNTLKDGSAKEFIVKRLESRMDLRGVISSTSSSEKKFNVFKIRLNGGW